MGLSMHYADCITSIPHPRSAYAIRQIHRPLCEIPINLINEFDIPINAYQDSEYLVFVLSFILPREWKEKFDLVDDEETDTLTYNYKNTFIYKKEKNGPGLTGDEIVTMANPRT